MVMGQTGVGSGIVTGETAVISYIKIYGKVRISILALPYTSFENLSWASKKC